MPNARDFTNSPDAAFLLIGDSGTHKTFFIGTCPKPIYVFDFDKGMAILAGQDVEYDTFRELPRGEPKRANSDLYEYGKAWPAFLKKINEIGAAMDAGTCPYKTLGFDSLTFMADVCMSFVLSETKHKLPEIQDWGAFLNNMSTAIGQMVNWPGIKVLTAHIRRMENDLTKLEEKLPMVAGQMGGKVSTFFDEVYFTNVDRVQGKDEVKFTLQTLPDNVVKQAKSRRWNVPNKTETSFLAVAKHAGLKL